MAVTPFNPPYFKGEIQKGGSFAIWHFSVIWALPFGFWSLPFVAGSGFEAGTTLLLLLGD